MAPYRLHRPRTHARLADHGCHGIECATWVAPPLFHSTRCSTYVAHHLALEAQSLGSTLAHMSQWLAEPWLWPAGSRARFELLGSTSCVSVLRHPRPSPDPKTVKNGSNVIKHYRMGPVRGLGTDLERVWLRPPLLVDFLGPRPV
eukprot:5156679-Pyramimonas_sp.AAC.1